jgi:anti-sigma regulatory factor (Ser/Thr protein kinase)
MNETFTAEAHAPALARRAAAEYAAAEGADADTLASIKLCVSEAVTNAVVHAYRDGARPGAVEVEARRPNGCLCVYIRDQGCGMGPRTDSPGMGLGLPLISHSAAKVEFREREGGGTELVMGFELAA